MPDDEQHDESEPERIVSGTYIGRKRNESIHMKILVPSGAVGAIIGKGGKSIAQIQLETGARIKLSKPNDFYPGTTERVCLIQGTVDGVTRMHNYIMDRMLEKPECANAGETSVGATTSFKPTSTGAMSATSDTWTTMASSHIESTTPMAWHLNPGSRLPWGRHQQVKILVPNCTAGLVIGKLGSYVKEIKDRTRAFIQISQKSKEINLLERCITIAGEPDQCRAAVALVLAKIAEDPQSTSCPTISYSRIQGPVASAYPTGSPFAFAAVSRFPLAQSLARSDVPQTAATYVPMGDPYVSPVVQAAFLQAALALNQRNYIPSVSPHTFVTASPSPSQSTSHPAIPHLSTQFTRLSPSRSVFDTSVSYSTELASMYASIPLPSGSSHLLATGSPVMWGASCDPTWNATADSRLIGSTGATGNVATAATYEPAYATPLNFAYYASNQPIIAPVASRHPSETYSLRTDLYSPTPYGTTLSLPFTTPTGLAVVTSPCGTGTVTPLYTAVYSSQPSMGESSSNVSKTLNLSSSAIPLSDLFGSLRIGSTNVPREFTPSDFNPLLSGLSPLPGMVGMGGYSVLSAHPTSTTLHSNMPYMPSGSFTSRPRVTSLTTTDSTSSVNTTQLEVTPESAHHITHDPRSIVPSEQITSKLTTHFSSCCDASSSSSLIPSHTVSSSMDPVSCFSSSTNTSHEMTKPSSPQSVTTESHSACDQATTATTSERTSSALNIVSNTNGNHPLYTIKSSSKQPFLIDQSNKPTPNGLGK